MGASSGIINTSKKEIIANYDLKLKVEDNGIQQVLGDFSQLIKALEDLSFEITQIRGAQNEAQSSIIQLQ